MKFGGIYKEINDDTVYLKLVAFNEKDIALMAVRENGDHFERGTLAIFEKQRDGTVKYIKCDNIDPDLGFALDAHGQLEQFN